jgi:ribose transport system substrate-binding protein
MRLSFRRGFIIALSVCTVLSAASASSGARTDIDLNKPLNCGVKTTPAQLLNYKVPKANQQYDITLMEVTLNGYYYQAIAYGAAKAAKEAGVKLRLTAAKGYTTPALQLQQAENVIQRGTDAVVFAPVDIRGSVATVEKFRTANVPVVNISTEVDTNRTNSVIMQDDYLMGVAAAQEIHRLLPDGGTGILMAGPANATWSRKRANGFSNTVKRNKSWNIKIAAAPTQLVDPAEGLKDFVNAAQADPDIAWIANVYYYILPVDSLPARFKQAKHVTMGFEPGSIDGLNNGNITSILPITPVWMGYVGVGYAVSILNGQTVPKLNCIPFPAITRANQNGKFAKGELFPPGFKASAG